MLKYNSKSYDNLEKTDILKEIYRFSNEMKIRWTILKKLFAKQTALFVS